MSKKHFVAIAAALKVRLNRAADASAEIAIEDVARDLCWTFAQANPRFDRSRFLAACGVEP